MLLCKKKKCSHANICSDTRLYRYICFRHQRHTAGFGERFDWFGAYVVGFVTAIGGGTIRDLLLDVTPGWMTDPIYLICTGLALLWVIFFGKHLIHLHNTFFIFDTIGLALFTVVGVGKSLALGYPSGWHYHG